MDKEKLLYQANNLLVDFETNNKYQSGIYVHKVANCRLGIMGALELIATNTLSDDESISLLQSAITNSKKVLYE